MMEFDFTLKFRFPDTSIAPGDYVERLGEAGCDDALIGVGKAGRIALDFTREAATAYDALASAVADVKRAVPDAQLIEASPDLVGLTDVADFIGCSRQYMRKLMINSDPGFPPPIHEGKAALWRLSRVLLWLKDSKEYQIEDSLLDVARATMQFNIAREACEIDRVMQKDIQRLVS